ncbi:hypothetical protein [Kordia sp.]|uniref:hypothetical protein n=1 Tax=Kordia sp. TaxID=1965332 RepID=UPI003D275073
MEKSVTLSNQTRTSISSIHLNNNSYVFSLKINKDWLFTWARRIGIIALLIGYIMITIMSYTISPVYFWTFVKAGVVLSLLSIIALSKN